MASYSSKEAIDAYYEGQKAPVNAEMENTTAAYEEALKRLQQQKEQSDADAYRSYVRQQRELPAIMRAQGNHGGMVDSAVASLLNKYNQGRANRGLQLNAGTSDQTLQYNAQMNNLRAKLAQYEQQAAAAKAELEAQQSAARRGGRRRAKTEDEITDPDSGAVPAGADLSKLTGREAYEDKWATRLPNGRIPNRTIYDDRYGYNKQATTAEEWDRVKPRPGWKGQLANRQV